MKTFSQLILRWEFEYRIFVSLGIVLGVCMISAFFYNGNDSIAVTAGAMVNINAGTSALIGFIVSALCMVLASSLRMWSGSILSSDRVMAFRVQDSGLHTRGPYQFVRNPIYLSDLIAMAGFALCLPVIGLFLPVLFYMHYRRLVRYEENSLALRFDSDYRTFVSDVPRFFPRITSILHVHGIVSDFKITYDGFRYNALYVLFAVGYITAVFTGEFFHTVIIGLPGVFDWAIHHTKKGLKTQEGKNGKRLSSNSKVFEDILYAQCWEDPQMDREAFSIQSDDVIFSITSGGCNVLTFLLDDPRKIIALDISPYQNYLLKLKIAAFRQLSYDELLEFFGVRNSSIRTELYIKVMTVLDENSRAYWNNQPEKIDQGLIHCGRFEHYLRLLRVWLHRTVGLNTIKEFFETESTGAREALYRRAWDTFRWRLFTKILLSRTVMTLLFDKAFFAYLDHSFSFSRHFASRTKHALTELPTKENYFLSYILLGRYYSEEHLPPYLRRENFDIIRNRLDRIELITDRCERYFSELPDDCISQFNFTNIFEWMSPETFHDLLRHTIRVARHGAVLTYRNLLVFRERPETLAHLIISEREAARSLHERDLSFIYSNYVVETISKEI